ncbi:hypothetical protein TUMEXPCC7403_23330 [Tumidithrix helvetica PCC 7403]|uniref:hypothetical protein n=1 Tax=Tumidithrix helvetica TaxID=3457545 RepID=UPI003CAE03E8
MKSYSTYYVRTGDIENTRRVFSKVEEISGSPWLMCNYCKDDGPPDDEILFGEDSLAEAKSAEVGEVIFLYGDTSIDSFVYERAKNGVLLRKLVWFALLDDDWTSGWVCVEGEPEEWEKTLFREDTRDRFIYNERQRYEDEGNADSFPDYEAEIREAWNAKVIVAGKTYPSCDGTVVLLVEQAYDITRPT